MKNLYDAAKQKCASIRRGPFGDVRTAYTRDGAGRVVAETSAAANCETQMVTRVYDSRGRVTRETAANGSTTTTSYSADDRVTTITNADGGTEVTTRNADGSIAAMTGTAVTPEFTSYFVYDAHGHLVSQTDAATNTTSYAYDAMDRVTAITNALGGVTTRTYDTRGNLLSEGGATYPVNYGYDIYGNRTSLTTFRDKSTGIGDTTTWLYDEASGLVTNKIYADGHGPTYAYDANGLIATRTWARGVVTTYAYDGWGNLTNTVYSDGTPSIVRTYDALGRLASVTDVKGTAVYAYDAYGSVTNEATTGVYTKSLTRHRDAYGRDIGHSVDGVRANTITYDSANGRIVGTQIGTTDFQWSYLHGTDLKSQLTCGAVGVTSWSYEQHRDLLTQVQNRVNGTVVSQYDYTSDALARRTQIAKSGSAMAVNRTDTYGYNVRNELISAAHDGTNEYTYVYDDIGNRLSSYELGTNRDYTANCLNQYEAITSDAQTTDYPRFDLDGNQTNVTTRTGTWSVVYNGENRPILWTSGPTNLTMRYDFMGRRVEYIECVGSVTNKHQRFVYDGYLCIQRLNGFNNSLSDRFEWDPTELVATRPLYMQACTTDGSYEFFYTHDGNKNVSELVSFQSAIGVTAHYEYAPFGQMSCLNPGANNCQLDFCSQNPLCFSSEYSDAICATTCYTYRHYESMSGRWLSFEPMLRNAGNLVLTCGNNLVDHSDILGLLSQGDSVEVRDGMFDVGKGNIGTIHIDTFGRNPFYVRPKRHGFTMSMTFSPGESFCDACDKTHLRWFQEILSDTDNDPDNPYTGSYPKVERGNNSPYYPMPMVENAAVRWTPSGQFTFSDSPTVYKRNTIGESTVSFKTCLVCDKTDRKKEKLESATTMDGFTFTTLNCVNWTIIYGRKIGSNGQIEEYFNVR